MKYDVNTLIENNLNLANNLAYNKKKKLQKNISFEELQSAAYLGLTEAANKFKPELGFAFTTYAYHKIMSSINDYLRELGFRLSSIESEEEEFCIKDTLICKEKESDIFQFIEEFLGEQALQMMKFYFLYKFSMKEIGFKLNLSEGRVCQLITNYKKSIQEKLLTI